MDEKTLKFIRVLIGDAATPYTFSDEDIETVYTGVGESTYLAGAVLLETAAATEALTYKLVHTDDLKVDGAAAAKILPERAERWRERAAADAEKDPWGAFEVVYPADSCRRCLENGECYCMGRGSWGFGTQARSSRKRRDSIPLCPM